MAFLKTSFSFSLSPFISWPLCLSDLIQCVRERESKKMSGFEELQEALRENPNDEGLLTEVVNSLLSATKPLNLAAAAAADTTTTTVAITEPAAKGFFFFWVHPRSNSQNHFLFLGRARASL